MNDVATHIRIFDATPSDDLVKKRGLAVKDIATRFQKSKNLVDLLIIAENVAAAAIDVTDVEDNFAMEMAKIVNAHSPSFVREGHDVELVATILMGANQLFADARPQTANLTVLDVLAGGVWSALAYQPPMQEAKLEALRRSVMTRAREWALEAGEISRQRVAIPVVAVKLPDAADIQSVPEAVKAGTATTIAALRDNSTLDREEINILWWALSDYSGILNASYAQQPELVGSVVGGLELAAMLRRLPADAHRHLALRHISGKSKKKYTLTELIDTLGDQRSAVTALYSENSAVSACPHVFPLIRAIVDGESDDLVKLSASDWGARALLEGALLNTTSMINGK